MRLKSTGKPTWDAIKTCRNNIQINIDQVYVDSLQKSPHQRQEYKAHGMTARPDAKHYETLTLVTLTKVCTLNTSLPKTGHVLTKSLES